jgi:hypothetical protein
MTALWEVWKNIDWVYKNAKIKKVTASQDDYSVGEPEEKHR